MPTENGGERESSLQSGWTVEGRAETTGAAAEASTAPEVVAGSLNDVDGAGQAADIDEVSGDTDDAPAQMGNLMVVLLGLTGGLYMLFAWIWLSWAQYYSETNAVTASGSGSIGGILQQIVFWIAPLAPVLWFLSAFFMLRGKPRALTIALVIGLIVLVPLPMIFTRGAVL